MKSAEKARNLAEITLLRIVARSECGTADADVAVYVHSDFRGGEIYFRGGEILTFDPFGGAPPVYPLCAINQPLIIPSESSFEFRSAATAHGKTRSGNGC